MAACTTASEVGTPAATANVVDLDHGRALFAEHCAVCHGAQGEGDGLASEFLHPPARRFSSGRFRLASSVNGVPSQRDLVATLSRGIPGSSMPAWSWLSDADLNDLAGQVRELALDGVARKLEQSVVEASGTIDAPSARTLAELAFTSSEPVRVPRRVAPSPSVLARGRALYRRDCATCHGEDGRGRQDEPRWTEDGTLDWARDFTAGILKGGASFEALATRIQVGMPGTAMPSFASFSDGDLSALVNYVSSLIPPASEGRLVHRRGELLVGCADGELPTDPGDSRWDGQPELEVVLAPLVWHSNSRFDARLSALHNGSALAVRVHWADPTRDDGDAIDLDLRDAVSLAFSNERAPPLFGMGSPEHPVNLWHWRAERLIDADAVLYLINSLPHVLRDPLFGDARADVAPLYVPAPSFSASGGAVSDLTAESFETIRHRDLQRPAVESRARWANGEWGVVFQRPLDTGELRAVRFERDATVNVACAVWDGSAGDRGGCKSISIWQVLKLAR